MSEPERRAEVRQRNVATNGAGIGLLGGEALVTVSASSPATAAGR